MSEKYDDFAHCRFMAESTKKKRSQSSSSHFVTEMTNENGMFKSFELTRASSALFKKFKSDKRISGQGYLIELETEKAPPRPPPPPPSPPPPNKPLLSEFEPGKFIPAFLGLWGMATAVDGPEKAIGFA